ncbi:hypothetical protein ACFVVC_18340 [Pseudarthrobacter sp. NPDC058196]|uniref:hypothetical protein n=1 Tax=Pseudarthrobacter sp. NPDC058196 TaxID=3346376 RepID=UPI0036D785F3
MGVSVVFNNDVKSAIEEYVNVHIGDENWHADYFSFISDSKLAARLGEEFNSARYIYKMLEGVGADGWLLRAQIRIQILQYASIYEAVIHHILFDELATDPAVVALTEFPTNKKISIPAASQAQLEKHLSHDGKEIIPTYEAIGKTSSTKVRFDNKANCASLLGIITEDLRDDLIDIYEARNAIHIHAEIRKSLDYQLDLSKRAYRRMKPFRDQIEAWQASNTAV